MRNAWPIHTLRLSSSMTTIVFLAICITVSFTGHIQAEDLRDDIKLSVVSWTPTNSYSVMTQPPPGTQVGSMDNSQTKQLPDYEPLDRDEFLGQVETAMATRGFSERIDHFSGTLHLNQVDLVLPGNAGLDIVIQHYYSSNVWNRVDNSLLTRHVPSADLSGRLGGNGWQLHMGKLMNVSPGVDSFTSLILPDGSNHTLYSRDGHSGEKITPEGWIYSVTGSVHTVQTTTGLRYHFDSAVTGAQYTYLGYDGASPIQVLQCTRIEDLNGNAIVIEYSQAPGNPLYETRIDKISFDDVNDLREVVFAHHGTTAILDTMQLRNDSAAIETWTFTYYGPPYSAIQEQFGGATVAVYPLANVVHSITGDYATEMITNAWQYNYYPWDPTPTPLTDGLLLIESVVSPRVGKVSFTWGPEVMDTGAQSCTEIPAFLAVQTRTTAVAISDNPIVYEDETTSTYTYTNGGQEDATTSVVTKDSQTDPALVLSTEEHVFHGWDTHVSFDPNMWKVGRQKSSTVVLKDDAGADFETITTTNVWEQGSQISADTRWSSSWVACGGPRYSGTQTYAKPTSVTRVVERHDSIPDPPPPTPVPDSYTTVSSVFDDYGNVGLVTESSDDGLARTTTFTYWQESTNNIMVGRIQGQDADPGGTMCFTYDTAGRVTTSYENPQTDDVSICEPTRAIVGARQSAFVYYTSGNLETQTEVSTPNNRVTTHTNYVYGKPKDTVVTTGTGSDIHYCRDYKPRGMTAWETDGRGCSTNYQTVYTYDFLGRLKTVDPPLADPINYLYEDQVGQPIFDLSTAFVARGNRRLEYRFDRIGSGNLTAIYKHIGATPTTTQLFAVTNDALGRRRHVQQLWGARMGDLFSYDPLARLTIIVHPDTSSTQVTIDYAGSEVTVTDENSHITDYVYEAFGDPNDRRLASLTDAGAFTTTYGYETVFGNLNSVDAPIAQGDRSFTYYSGTTACNNGFLSGETHPESGATTYAYNCLGDTTTRTREGTEITNYVYDQAGRLTDINYSDTSSDVDITYDQASRRTSVTNDNASAVFVYDDAGRLSTVTQSIVGGPLSQVTSYTYDTLDRLYTMTYPSTRVVTYGWNDDNWLTSVTGADGSGIEYLTGVTHHVTGAIDLVTFGNTVTADHGIDDLNRLDSILTTAPGGQLLNVTFGYDDASNLTTWNDNLAANEDRTFGYDSLDRLTSATAPNLWGSLGFVYDELGNRKSKTHNSFTTAYSYESSTNRLTDLSGADQSTYTYDDVGRLIEEQRILTEGIFADGFETGDTSAWSSSALKDEPMVTYDWDYTFNEADQLVQVSRDSSVVGDYVYDGDNLRVSKTFGETTTYYLRNAEGNTLAEYNQELDLIAEYVYANGRQVAKVVPDGVGGDDFRFFHADHLGSSLSITDEVGAVVWTGTYFPFGEVFSSDGEADRYRFTQHELDTQTGFLYAKARYYHPGIGRFLSNDPVGGNVEASQSWNRYSYTLNNPLIFVDPDGREVTYADARDQQFYEGAAARNWRVRGTLDAFGPGSGRDLHIERGTPRPHPQGIPVLANTEVNISQESDTQGMIDAYDAAGGGEAGEAAALAVPPVLGEVTSATITLGPNPTGHTRLHELGHVNQALGNPSEYLEQQQEASQATSHAAYQGTESERYANGYARDARRNDPVPPGE